MNSVRWTLGTVSVVLLGVGGWLLLDTRSGTVCQVLLWLVGAVAVHDGLLVPLVLLVGIGLRLPHRHLPAYALTALRGGLVVAGSLTLLAFPLLIRQGRGRNPSVLPLDYAGNWSALLAGTFLVTLALLVGAGVRARRRSYARSPGPTPGSVEGTGRREEPRGGDPRQDGQRPGEEPSGPG